MRRLFPSRGRGIGAIALGHAVALLAGCPADPADYPFDNPWDPAAAALDFDGDGIPNGEDRCPDVPSVRDESRCDGVDDDCNGETDEGLQNACGSCGTAPEEVCNGLDDDCDGETDEGLGPIPADEVRGECAMNVQVCSGGGGYQDSPDNYVPLAELCNGLDDDCDGEADEGLTPIPAAEVRGECAGNALVCTGEGGYRDAPDNYSPTSEVCNGLDDDCNGEVDDGLGLVPAAEVRGRCAGNARVCLGAPGYQDAPDNYVSADEVCNGLDDDCDGETDEGLGPIPAAEVRGECADSIRVCRGAEGYVDSPSNYTPTDEVCNGLDDDCNGETDEDEPEGGGPCDTGELGACAAGTEHCRRGDLTCEPDREPSVEVCNGVDDDCDGETDEGLGQVQAAEVRGECVSNVQICTGAGGYQDSPGNYMPADEVCTGLDDDCDGETDEGCNGCPAETEIPEGWVCIPPTGPDGFVMGSPGPECGEGCTCGEDDGQCRDSRCPNGCPGAEPGQVALETQRRVVLTRPFLLKVTEVTQEEWRLVVTHAAPGVRTTPSYFWACGADCPVERVNWYESVQYVNWLSAEQGLEPCYELVEPCNDVALGRGCGPDAGCYADDGTYQCQAVRFLGLDCRGFRLPTEAEWEWAARAAGHAAFHSGEISVAGDVCQPVDPALDRGGWYCGNSVVQYDGCRDLSAAGGPLCAGPHPVARKEPNAWGLYDVHGNVAEWVWDGWSSNHQGLPGSDPTGPDPPCVSRVFRGGSWAFGADDCRSAWRYTLLPGHRFYYLGLRPARSVPR